MKHVSGRTDAPKNQISHCKQGYLYTYVLVLVLVRVSDWIFLFINIDVEKLLKVNNLIKWIDQTQLFCYMHF